MRVLFLAWRDLDHPDAGGSEVVVDELARGLQARGHQVALVCGGEHGEHGYPVLRNGGRGTQYLTAPWTTRRFRDADVLVEVINGLPFLSRLWWHKPRVRLLHHVHGRQWHQHFAPPVATVGRVVETEVFPRLARRDLVATVSPSTGRALAGLGLPPENLRLLELGIDDDLRVDRPVEAGEPLFVACGRLSPNKRYDLLLDVWDEVRRHVGGRLVLMGDGVERQALARRLPPSTELAGHVDERTKRRLLREAWVFVHAAHQEGWGLVLLEAAAAGTPSLAFDVPGVRDAVVDGSTGVLVADPESYAKQWVALAEDHGRRRRLAEAARQRAERFRWHHTVTQFEAVLEEAVGARPRHHEVDERLRRSA